MYVSPIRPPPEKFMDIRVQALPITEIGVVKRPQGADPGVATEIDTEDTEENIQCSAKKNGRGFHGTVLAWH